MRNLGNYIDITCIDMIDCKAKLSVFIGYVNKLKANYGKMNQDV